MTLAFSGPRVKLRVAFQFFPWLAEPSPPVAASTVSPWSRTLSWPVRGDAAWKGGKVLDGAGPGFALHVTRSCSALRLISKKKIYCSSEVGEAANLFSVCIDLHPSFLTKPLGCLAMLIPHADPI